MELVGLLLVATVIGVSLQALLVATAVTFMAFAILPAAVGWITTRVFSSMSANSATRR